MLYYSLLHWWYIGWHWSDFVSCGGNKEDNWFHRRFYWTDWFHCGIYNHVDPNSICNVTGVDLDDSVFHQRTLIASNFEWKPEVVYDRDFQWVSPSYVFIRVNGNETHIFFSRKKDICCMSTKHAIIFL